MRVPNELRLPLFPLFDVVHFPHTALHLHVFEPRNRALVRDLEQRVLASPWIGIVLLKPDGALADDRPEVYAAGTAGRLQAVEHLPDGTSNIVLRGEFRFEIERELDNRPYREALVRPIGELRVREDDPDVVELRRELSELVRALRHEIGDRFPVELAGLEPSGPFVALVNHVAADLDLPAPRKLELLAQPLPQRAELLTRILRSRRRVLDLLRPYRRFAVAAEAN